MFCVGQRVQILNHSEPQCNHQYGEITHTETGYDRYTVYYTVRLDETDYVCLCTADELMEG